MYVIRKLNKISSNLVLTSCIYRVCPDMGDTQCLGFLNEKSTEATWGELKKVLPVKECRLVHLPSKR